jgi:hypothetical protein
MEMMANAARLPRLPRPFGRTLNVGCLSPHLQDEQSWVAALSNVAYAQPESKGSCSSLDLHEPLRPFVCMNLATLCGRFVAQDSAPSAHRTAAGTTFALVWIFHGWQRLARLGNPGGGRRMKASFRNSGWGIRVHVGTIRDSSGFIRSKRRSRNRCIRFLSFGCIFLCQ